MWSVVVPRIEITTGPPSSDGRGSDCCSSVSKSCPTLCDAMDCSMPGFPVLHYLLEFAQTYVHWVSDAIQPSHPLPSLLLFPSIFPSISIFPMSWLFTTGGQSFWASAWILNIQGWFPLGLTGLIFLLSKNSQESSTTIQRYRFLGAQPSLWSHIHTWLLEKLVLPLLYVYLVIC